MARNIEISIGEYYHVYNRGTDKRNIFLSEKDYERFLILLHLGNSQNAVQVRELSQGLTLGKLFDLPVEKRIVDIGAYCLMPNHFHLLLREKQERGISLFLQKISTAYTMFFNKKYERTGALFSGTFKAEHADYDQYLKYLFSYIHLNPVKLIDPKWRDSGITDKKTAIEYLQKYRYSSFIDYSYPKQRKESVILNKDAFPEYFLNVDDFFVTINDWLSFPRLNLGVKPQGLTLGKAL